MTAQPVKTPATTPPAQPTQPALHFWDAYWDLRVKECPCDVHFVQWLDANRITHSTIYHFGTGGHHFVGIECAKPERQNAVLGITAAPQEYETYVKLAIERPDVLRAIPEIVLGPDSHGSLGAVASEAAECSAIGRDLIARGVRSCRPAAPLQTQWLLFLTSFCRAMPPTR